ncbi:hypothetical protein DFJ58DRAFT_790111 [Suillus subalutaceus]|uniref:uncharacterized protein n=1 Tax=Suillus subalutaceus TaxID=48586 RepID=UPI001B875928|nr:uncharacterized protein DFJ58DRAFT_790111 [Suillus subalutaceus]KAG1852845.1 hypothetical protein DFJ58DRAFT_790111 [Suillus subalutaceus]
MVQTLHSSLLLGVRPIQVTDSVIHAAFHDGLDQSLSLSHFSFIAVISGSSKYILHQAYACRQLSSPVQLFPFLSFETSGDTNFKSDMDILLPSLQEHLKRYFRGIGHPLHPLFAGVIEPAQRAIDNQDLCYRARRFIKLMSGISLLPSDDKSFTIILNQNIPDMATFNKQYDVQSDLLPPVFHACTYTMDLFANPVLRTFLQHPLPGDDLTVTPFDICLHAALFDAGHDVFNA